MLYLSIFVFRKKYGTTKKYQKSIKIPCVLWTSESIHPNPPGHQLHCPTRRAPWVRDQVVDDLFWVAAIFLGSGKCPTETTFKFCDWNTGRPGVERLDQIGNIFSCYPAKKCFRYQFECFWRDMLYMLLCYPSDFMLLDWKTYLIYFRQKSVEIWSLFCEGHIEYPPEN